MPRLIPSHQLSAAIYETCDPAVPHLAVLLFGPHQQCRKHQERCHKRAHSRRHRMQSQMRHTLLQHLLQRSQAQLSQPDRTLTQQALSSLVAEYLAASCRTCSLAVFIPEAGLDNATPLSHGDIMSLLKLSPPSPISADLCSGLAQLAANEGVLAPFAAHEAQAQACAS